MAYSVHNAHLITSAMPVSVSVVIVAVWLINLAAATHIAMNGLEVSFYNMSMVVKDTDTSQVKLLVDLSLGRPWSSEQAIEFKACESTTTTSTVCVELPNVVRFELQVDDELPLPERCFTVTWTSLSDAYRPHDCLRLYGAHWYGGSERYTQHWPANQQQTSMQPYVSGDLLQGDYYGSVLERYWLSSRGVAVHVDNAVPLHSSWNVSGDGRLCLKANYDDRHYPRSGDDQSSARSGVTRPLQLQYSVCQSTDMLSAHRLTFDRFYARPSAVPDLRMLRSPVWSTWARYKMHVNERDVLSLAEEIIEHGFPNSQLEIDDKYTPTYGELNFDPVKFPGGGQSLVERLHGMGFRVTTWVTPFVNSDSPPYREGVENGYFLTDSHGPALVRWWQGEGAMLDVTRKDAVDWFVGNLEEFRNRTGVDSFKFDAGENNWIPLGARTHDRLANPNEYATRYVEVLSRLGDMVETRVGYRSQRYPVFVRMMDKDSK